MKFNVNAVENEILGVATTSVMMAPLISFPLVRGNVPYGF
jgi:hypothetical protein